jgi:hypothetical protein
MKKTAFPVAESKDDVVMLEGGLDLVTPLLELKPGAARSMVNYECALNGGYTRVKGYERFDGLKSPSAQNFTLVPIVSFTNTPSVGQTLTGNTSATTGEIIAVTATYVCVTLLTGSGGYTVGETVKVGATTIGTVGAQSTVTLSRTLRKQYVNLAADVYRALIQAVPGKGPVRGVFGATFGGIYKVYAIRDQNYAYNQHAFMWQATAGGWASVPTSYELAFYNGSCATGQPADGSPLQPPGLTTWLTALRIVTESGSWVAGTARGRFVTTDVPSTSIGTGKIGDGTYTMESYGGTVLFKKGGRFKTVFGNFLGQEGSSRIYGCDGVNRAFEFDGTVIVPLATIQNVAPLAWTSDYSPWISPLDTPSDICIHHAHLFLAMGSSVRFSGVGGPYDWTATAGGGEFATGDTVTALMSLPGDQSTGALAVLERNHTNVLYGTALAGSSPFDLVSFQTETGAFPLTAQNMNDLIFLDDRGVVTLKAVQEYGNFASDTLTRKVQSFIDAKHGRAVGACLNRAKGQYRLFFNDGTALYLTMDNGKVVGIGTVYAPVSFSCAFSGEDASGNERSFVGGADGYVYELERGTSFDGTAIEHELVLGWNTMRSPRLRKTVHKLSIEIQDTDYTELTVGVRIGPILSGALQDFSSSTPSYTPTEEYDLPSTWDSFTWDFAWWDSHSEGPLEIDVKGTGTRLQPVIRGSSDYLDSYTLTSIISRYFPRRRQR